MSLSYFRLLGFLVILLVGLGCSDKKIQVDPSQDSSNKQGHQAEVLEWLLAQEKEVGNAHILTDPQLFAAHSKRLELVWERVVEKGWEEDVFRVFLGKPTPHPARIFAAKLSIACHRNGKDQVFSHIASRESAEHGAFEGLYLFHQCTDFDEAIAIGMKLIRDSGNSRSKRVGALVCALATFDDSLNIFQPNKEISTVDAEKIWGPNKSFGIEQLTKSFSLIAGKKERTDLEGVLLSIVSGSLGIWLMDTDKEKSEVAIKRLSAFSFEDVKALLHPLRWIS